MEINLQVQLSVVNFMLLSKSSKLYPMMFYDVETSSFRRFNGRDISQGKK